MNKKTLVPDIYFAPKALGRPGLAWTVPNLLITA